MSIKRTTVILWRRTGLIGLILFFSFALEAQQQYEINTGWQCVKANTLNKKGEEISKATFPLTGFMPAVVPGTVLTTLLQNKMIPDPFYGMNNKQIPDISKTGKEYYTYWFVKDFTETPAPGDKVWLMFRGINYSADIYLNGRKVNARPDKGMFLRQSYDITPLLAKDGHNRLAVIVYPPEPVGSPNDGQGGDGMIARSLTNQYVAGWDWIQPIHDRNTGIWDKVFIRKTKQLHIDNTHVITSVPGRRTPGAKQAAATIKVTAEVENPDGEAELEGTVQCEIVGKKVTAKVKVEPGTSELVEFPAITIDNPKLWWPNGYGPQDLYKLDVKLFMDKALADEEQVQVGIRELKAVWNTKTNSREIRVNGQKIFIKGGNWILSDALLRFSRERYDAEVRYHRDMNLNLIRVWGGGITERPEFYDACDKYGLLVMQDFWVSGDCNGRWYDPLKLEDTLARRKYPDDHALFLEAAEDQVMMLRNHPSLALWCGGNEIRPPADILEALRDSILPSLDGTRYFFEYSNDDSMSLNSHDGPYLVQQDTFFWKHRSYPFNSEIGSVGIGDYESLERFIPKADLVPPKYDVATHKWLIDSVWQYHRYIGYDSVIEAYGHPKDARDFATKAQLVNYNQYRALMEGATAHMWDWYTGIIMWKTQNPWTALRGQMYDVYLDPNACLYGMQAGAKPVHVMYDPVGKTIMVANNLFNATARLKVSAMIYDMKGGEKMLAESYTTVGATKVATCGRIGRAVDSVSRQSGSFLFLSLADSATGQTIDENIYWLPDARYQYSGLSKLAEAEVKATAVSRSKGRVEVTVNNPPGGPVAFFMRVSVIDSNTYDRILPAFCNNNYITVAPGQQRTVVIDYTPQKNTYPIVNIEGWNIEEQYLEIKEQ